MHLLFVGPPGLDRDIYVAMLAKAAIRATTADEPGDVEMDLFHGARPDVVVSDLLPRPDVAWEFVRQIRETFSDIPVVIFTPLIRPDGANRRVTRELGCAAFVAKPCSPSQLTKALRRVWSGERGLELTTYY